MHIFWGSTVSPQCATLCVLCTARFLRLRRPLENTPGKMCFLPPQLKLSSSLKLFDKFSLSSPLLCQEFLWFPFVPFASYCPSLPGTSFLLFPCFPIFFDNSNFLLQYFFFFFLVATVQIVISFTDFSDFDIDIVITHSYPNFLSLLSWNQTLFYYCALGKMQSSSYSQARKQIHSLDMCSLWICLPWVSLLCSLNLDNFKMWLYASIWTVNVRVYIHRRSSLLNSLYIAIWNVRDNPRSPEHGIRRYFTSVFLVDVRIFHLW
jgi:hypothetical protein